MKLKENEMRIDSRQSAAIVSAEYSPNVALFCGGSRNGRFSRCVSKDFIFEIRYERKRMIDYNEMFNVIKRKQ